jgi:hypothetical protein
MKNITSMSEDVSEKDVFGMIYSEFGMGKTTTTMALAQALRKDGRILFCDSSDWWVALEEFPDLMEDADRMRVEDPADLIVVANAMKTGKLKNVYDVVVLDEASSLYDVMLENFVRGKHGIGPDEPMPEIEGKEYGPPTAAFESLLRKFHELDGVHVLMTAHAREVGEEKELRPSFPPGAYKVTMRKLQFCGALSARRKMMGKDVVYDRSIQLKPTAKVSAKSRIPSSPMKVSPEELVELVTDWVDGETFVSDTQGVAAPQDVLIDIEEQEPEEAPEPAEADEVDEKRAFLEAMNLKDLRTFARGELGLKMLNEDNVPYTAKELIEMALTSTE